MKNEVAVRAVQSIALNALILGQKGGGDSATMGHIVCRNELALIILFAIIAIIS